MIKHIVMVRLRDTEAKLENATKLKEAIEGLMGVVPELKSMEVGLNLSTKASAYDLVLTSLFDTLEGLEAYRVHPEHKKVLELLYEVMEGTAVVDYEATSNTEH
ncbi:MAG: Dabb family protein [Bacteroidota bacterium]